MGRKFKFGPFDAAAYIVVTLAMFACVFPFMHIISLSLSSVRAVNMMKVRLLPVEFTLQTYGLVVQDRSMIRSMFFTITVVVVYTALAMVVTVSAAFALNKKRLAGRWFFMTLMIITMYFSGGIIPEYINMKNLGLTNTFWCLVLPGLLSVYNMIIMRSFFNSGVPAGIEESATIDGCSDFGVLLRIILPISKPVLSTITLFYAVGRWNGFMDALMYITNPNLYPLQLKLYQIVYNSMTLDIMQNEGAAASVRLPPDSLKSASVIFATFPILLVYPYLQKYFVVGVTLGSLKE